MKFETVLKFWFKGKDLKDWFGENPALDKELRLRFLKTYEAVVRGETEPWRKSPRGRLAEILILDQFSRNMFRGTPEMFRNDPLALALAQEAVRVGADKELTEDERMFVYLPFEHSESRKIQKQSIRLFKCLQNTYVLKYAIDPNASLIGLVVFRIAIKFLVAEALPLRKNSCAPTSGSNRSCQSRNTG